MKFTERAQNKLKFRYYFQKNCLIPQLICAIITTQSPHKGNEEQVSILIISKISNKSTLCENFPQNVRALRFAEKP
jgi:hypothetical protein